jgi:hypothetical protein
MIALAAGKELADGDDETISARRHRPRPDAVDAVRSEHHDQPFASTGA